MTEQAALGKYRIPWSTMKNKSYGNKPNHLTMFSENEGKTLRIWLPSNRCGFEDDNQIVSLSIA